MLLRTLQHRECAGSARSSRRRCLPGVYNAVVQEEERSWMNWLQKSSIRLKAGFRVVGNNQHETTKCRFRKCTGQGSRERVVAVSDEDGALSLLQYEDNKCVRDIGYYLIHNNAIFDVCWFDNHEKLVTGGGDCLVRIFDVQRESMARTLRGHLNSVRCVRSFNENPELLLSCGRSDRVILWDVRAKDSASAFSPHGVKQRGRPFQNKTTCATPSNDDKLIVTSGAWKGGSIKFWDRRSFKEPVKEILPPNPEWSGISDIKFDASGSRLSACYVGGNIVVYDWLADQPACRSQLIPHMEHCRNIEAIRTNFDKEACFSPDGSSLICGSTENGAWVWDISCINEAHIQWESPKHLPKHLEPVQNAKISSVDWSSDQSCIVTCTKKSVHFFSATVDVSTAPIRELRCETMAGNKKGLSIWTPTNQKAKRASQSKNMQLSVQVFDPNIGTQDDESALGKRNRQQSLHEFFQPRKLVC